ncbi:ABC-type multidrug transport system, ATPase component [Thermococcus kodakarensis KOD1]|uniref:ABC-type multidrug transport system, ATPase component n=1 Tax=Thermococcus kodakarensis (strain ATCC BAA-918 / JCM 12380 / KOD1) TaxID=69014 RepID=Q5JCX0_THEKO|nr:ABC transporter ATP-binding protein [Thermococcus kodakarensis]WCN28427.1 ABC transporter ATP-binding protein [Thermococcus kodakarensis]WCN30723.1 ABC transporter ATP-binding protein [Thermococcus kodakarensis]BAD84544.1 ABC-type multidrug transport system, ATPase component [Thermococcus kodakarensis KOD1]
MSSQAILIENLTKSYGTFRAVDGLTFDVKVGEVFGFLGPNGAGKTTTILSMLGIIIPDDGRIEILGMDMSREPIKIKERIGYLPENATIYGELTAWKNLEFFANFYRMSNSEREKRITELLKRVGLWDARYRKAKTFSKGMKQRLLLAQALINDPELLILDEPTSGLDPEGAHLVKEVIREAKAEGRTVFFSSHILSEVEELSDRVGIIVRGRLKAVGPIREIKRQFMELEGYEIKVETKEPIPELRHEEITRVERLAPNRIILFARSDIREWLSQYLTSKGVTILSLEVEEPSLEDVFMKTIYGRDEE